MKIELKNKTMSIEKSLLILRVKLHLIRGRKNNYYTTEIFPGNTKFKR